MPLISWSWLVGLLFSIAIYKDKTLILLLSYTEITNTERDD